MVSFLGLSNEIEYNPFSFVKAYPKKSAFSSNKETEALWMLLFCWSFINPFIVAFCEYEKSEKINITIVVTFCILFTFNKHFIQFGRSNFYSLIFFHKDYIFFLNFFSFIFL